MMDKDKLEKLFKSVCLFFRTYFQDIREVESKKANLDSARITTTKLQALRVNHEQNKPHKPQPPKPVPDCSVNKLGTGSDNRKKKRETAWAQLSHTRLKALSNYEG